MRVINLYKDTKTNKFVKCIFYDSRQAGSSNKYNTIEKTLSSKIYYETYWFISNEFVLVDTFTEETHPEEFI